LKQVGAAPISAAQLLSQPGSLSTDLAPQAGRSDGLAGRAIRGAARRAALTVAMADVTPEFSRLVRLDRLGSQPFRRRIEATAEEREKLCRRFDLLSLERLTAAVDLSRQSGEVIRLEASFEAEFVQSCVLTLEPVPDAISDRFSLVFGPPEGEPQEIALGRDDAAFEPLAGDAIDIGEAVAQELSLALPVSPHLLDASNDIGLGELSSKSPFASLARLRRPAQS
jgi:uncharacterized metal-binding protein YceD (DUF177 family)